MVTMELQIGGGEGGLRSCSVGWQPWSPNLEDERMLDSAILIEEDKCMSNRGKLSMLDWIISVSVAPNSGTV